MIEQQRIASMRHSLGLETDMDSSLLAVTHIPLRKHHLEQLHVESAIPLEIILEEGYKSSVTKDELELLGFEDYQITNMTGQVRTGILMPLRNPVGEIVGYIHKPDNPRLKVAKQNSRQDDGSWQKTQKAVKYEFVAGAKKRLHVPIRSIPHVKNSTIPLLITEGHKKASSASVWSGEYCIVMIDGVYSWRNSSDGALPDWENIPLKDREIILAFDSDAWNNPNVQGALNRLASWLESRGSGLVTKLVLPMVNNDPKTGLDDWRAASPDHTLDEFNRLVTQSKILAQQTKAKLAKQTEDYIKVLRTELGCNFRFNDVLQRIEINGTVMTKEHYLKLRCTLRDMGYGRQLTPIEEAWQLEAYRNAYHPIRKYLNNLPEWDGVDYIQRLAAYFHEVDTHEEAMIAFDIPGQGPFPIWLKKWLVGCVAKAMRDDYVRNAMLVLHSSRQNIGKSFFCKWLAKDVEGYWTDSIINPDDKDCRLKLAYKWIWEAGELESITNRRDVGALKAFLTKQDVDERKAYDRESTIMRPLASFMGTVNDPDFLNDPTGTTRFMVSSLNSIDFSYSQTLEPAMIWSQAVALYRKGYRWTLSEREAKLSARINKYYEYESPLVAEIFQHYDIHTGDPKETEWIPAKDIGKTLMIDPSHSGRMRDLHKAMKQIDGVVMFKKRINGSTPLRGFYGLIKIDNGVNGQNGHNGAHN